MGEDTKIQWCHHTFNPWRGCTKVSAGCAHCYAETLSKRNPGVLGVWGDNGTRVVAAESYWRQPLKWDREAKAAGERRRVFCASLADVFEDIGERNVYDSAGNVLWEQEGRVVSAGRTTVGLVRGERPATLNDVRGQLWDLIDETPNLDWLLLTKRPENLERMLPWTSEHAGEYRERYWPNIWLGTSVENQPAADNRIPHLLRVPAKVRFLSVEPMLGPVDLIGRCYLGHKVKGVGFDAMFGTPPDRIVPSPIDLVIFGGESGPDARPCDLAWIRDGVRQCKAAGVSAFVKQLGANPVDTTPPPPGSSSTNDFDRRIRLRDSHGGDWSEWPADLRVREMPRVEEPAS